MTTGEWLDLRTALAPAKLAARMRSLLGDDLGVPADPLRMAQAAARALGVAFTGSEPARDAALDLLAVDALVTAALERAVGSPDGVAATASVMECLSRAADSA